MSVAIRRIEISRFRGVDWFEWCPSPGINCLVGPGDTGKSTILDAIDLCLGARRTVQVTDADFYCLDTTRPISIVVTLGQLTNALKSIDAYGPYLRGFDASTGKVEGEPGKGLETVLSLALTISADLEPVWSLVSKRAEERGFARNLAWKDRLEVAPLRIGAYTAHNFSWQRGSVLTRLSEERVEVSGALMAAARSARSGFGDAAEPQLQSTLETTGKTAVSLGVDIGSRPRALLDAHAASFTAGGIALHSETGVPLRNLGTGSARLMVAGLQKAAAHRVPIVLVDEVEHGLEPQRLIRFLHALGSKDTAAASQCFMSTHSPVALKELSAGQLVIVRGGPFGVEARSAGDLGVDGAIRAFPDALLSRAVVVCEGATEVGFLRGLDLYRESHGSPSICARGAALVDGGGNVNQIYSRALAFRRLGYPTLLVRDSDLPVPVEVDAPFTEAGGVVAAWRPGHSLEAELFTSLSNTACLQMLDYAQELYGDLVAQHITTASNNALSLAAIIEEGRGSAGLSESSRRVLGLAASRKKTGWFKQIGLMEHVARHFVGPALGESEAALRESVDRIFSWIHDHGS